MVSESVRSSLQRVYNAWHHPCFISPDPLEVVRSYRRHRDREIAALLCASLALGRVDGIIRACRHVLAGIGKPSSLKTMPVRDIRKRLAGFRYRFFDSEELVRFLNAVGNVLREYGSIESAFASGLSGASEQESPAIQGLIGVVGAMRSGDDPPKSIILSDPEKQSAAKRLHLFLRWMVRNDTIDPGGWDVLDPVYLLVPVDVHMHRLSVRLRLTARRSVDRTTSHEITRAFREVDPLDPVRFDFSLTRVGIHPEGGAFLFPTSPHEPEFA